MRRTPRPPPASGERVIGAEVHLAPTPARQPHTPAACSLLPTLRSCQVRGCARAFTIAELLGRKGENSLSVVAPKGGMTCGAIPTPR